MELPRLRNRFTEHEVDYSKNKRTSKSTQIEGVMSRHIKIRRKEIPTKINVNQRHAQNVKRLLRIMHYRQYKKTKAGFIFVWLLILVFGGAFLYFDKFKTPAVTLPENILSSLNFVSYVPSKLPKGYRYDSNSAKISSGFLFFKLSYGSKVISVSEQAVPTGINLHALPNYNDIQVSIGKAVLGTSLNNPSVAILTPTTLINVISSNAINKDDLVQIAQSFKAIKNQGTFTN